MHEPCQSKDKTHLEAKMYTIRLAVPPQLNPAGACWSMVKDKSASLFFYVHTGVNKKKVRAA